MDTATLESLEIIDPTPLDPWGQAMWDRIAIEQDSVQALEAVTEMMGNGENVIFTEASAKDSRLRAAVVKSNHPTGQMSTRQIGEGSTTFWTVHATELIAIDKATL